MGFFGNKKEEKVEKVVEKAVVNPSAKASTELSRTSSGQGEASPAKTKTAPDVILAPRITEKASENSTEGGVYVFNVIKSANKIQIGQAVEAQFKVKPKKVRVMNYKAKKRFIKGKWGSSASGKKAYIYLKKGDTIQLM
ncbi:50S ribosomal protein L23 [Candidatus Wolfebacteria bacterium]|nr:MAG: 50S ribosomal protein L23 [Candidatus Wolfebacteria bacterium]